MKPLYKLKMMKCIRQVMILWSLLMVVSCNEKKSKETIETPTADIDTLIEIPSITVDISLLHYDNKTSTWTFNSKLYSGYAVSYFQDSTLEEKTGFLNGRKQNQSTLWFSDKHLKRITNYHKGKLHGVKKSWSPDEHHVLVSQLNYYKGKAHGKQKMWYTTGEVYKILNLNMGREDGLQQAFRKNGELYANYEAKEGRIFGLKKSALCYGLEDENINYEN